MKLPDTRSWESMLDGIDEAVVRLGDKPLLLVPTDDGYERWTAIDVARRSRYAAWRLAAAGMHHGDRLLTLGPSGPALGTIYAAAWRANVVPVPLDQRYTADVIGRVAEKADATVLAVADEERAARGLVDESPLQLLSIEQLLADPDATFPPDWEEQMAAWPRPKRSDLYMIMYTSGTTGHPRGVMLRHQEQLAFGDLFQTLRVRLLLRAIRSNFRTIAVMPMTHIFGLGTWFAVLTFGGEVVYPKSVSPRALMELMRSYQPTSMSAAPQFLELLWRQLVRSVAARGASEAFEAKRARAKRLPYWARRRMFRRELALLGGQLKMLGSGAAFLPPDLQEAWESLGIPVTQGYGATEAGGIANTSRFRHPVGKVGKVSTLAKVELAEDGEVLVKGPAVTSGYWRDPEATRQSWDEQGRYHTGDIGRFDEKGNLVLLGRKRNMIVRADGLKVYPEDIEQALHAAGLGDTVVLETTPGRIEAVVLDPEREAAGATTVAGAESTPEARRAAIREKVDAALREANAQLTVHERVDAWKLWPEADFPRTHSAKIRRDRVHEWATEAAGSGAR